MLQCFRWTTPVNNANLVTNGRATVVTGLACTQSAKTATIINLKNNNSVNNNNTNNNHATSTNNTGRVLEAKLDPSDSIIMAVDPLERSFNNMHETVPPAQLGNSYDSIRLFLSISINTAILS